MKLKIHRGTMNKALSVWIVFVLVACGRSPSNSSIANSDPLRNLGFTDVTTVNGQPSSCTVSKENCRMIDNFTKLQWLTFSLSRYSYTDISQYCGARLVDGVQQWRLPTLDEAKTLLRNGSSIVEHIGSLSPFWMLALNDMQVSFWTSDLTYNSAYQKHLGSFVDLRANSWTDSALLNSQYKHYIVCVH